MLFQMLRRRRARGSIIPAVCQWSLRSGQHAQHLMRRDSGWALENTLSMTKLQEMNHVLGFEGKWNFRVARQVAFIQHKLVDLLSALSCSQKIAREVLPNFDVSVVTNDLTRPALSRKKTRCHVRADGRARCSRSVVLSSKTWATRD